MTGLYMQTDSELYNNRNNTSWLVSNHKAVSPRYLRRGLQISKRNDFFVDKKFNGLLLPVVHVTVQFICVHSFKRAKRMVSGFI